jgi:hypothetical protein
MNYWITTHWPPRNDEDGSDTGTDVWVPEGRQQASEDMRADDMIAVYETKSGRTEIRQHQDGSTFKTACKPGREGVICYGRIDARISADPESQSQDYSDGTSIWWRWYAPISILSRSGFVGRQRVLEILGYRSTWNLRGFGDFKSGLKKITKAEFDLLVQEFHALRPVELPVNRGGGSGGHGEGEGETHLNLKNYP